MVFHPGRDRDPGVIEAHEQGFVEQFVAHASVERLRYAVPSGPIGRLRASRSKFNLLDAVSVMSQREAGATVVASAAIQMAAKRLPCSLCAA
jgi:hypothetical protein